MRRVVQEKSSSDPAAAHADDSDADPAESSVEDPDVEAGADEAAAADVEAGADEPDEAAQPEQPKKPARRWLRWAAAVVLALVLAGAGYEGWLLYQHHQREVAADQALEAAKKFSLALTTVDPNALDKNFTDVLDGATGEFKDMYGQSSEQLRQLLIENKAAAHGTVIDAAVKSATKDQVVVMLFIDQSVSNAAVPEPQLDRSRVVMTMDKVDGRWLASKIDMP